MLEAQAKHADASGKFWWMIREGIVIDDSIALREVGLMNCVDDAWHWIW